MGHHWRVLRAALRAAAWRATWSSSSVPVSVPVLWALAVAAAELAYQYFGSADVIFYTSYGLSSSLAGAAILSAVVLLFAPDEKAFAVSAALALNALWFLVLIAASLLARAVDWPAWLPAIRAAGDAVILRTLLVAIWWIGALAAIYRSVDIYRGTIGRAVGTCLVTVVAVALVPTLPMFVGSNFAPRTPNVWDWARSTFAARKDVDTPPPIDMAKLDLTQGALLDANVRRLLPERSGTADIYAIGVAGWSDQDVFIKELNGGLKALDGALAMDRGAVRLINHINEIEQSPIASRGNFASAVHYVAGLMNRDEDVLLIFITSHGSQSGVGLVLGDAMSATLTPDDIASVLAREGIKNRIVIVSACYAGVFLEPLANPDSYVITAADADNTSFGCSNEREWTYFGDAFFNQALRPGVSLEDAFASAKATISQWEARDNLPASNPQAYFGASLTARLASRASDGRRRASGLEEGTR